MPPHVLYSPVPSISSMWDYVPVEILLCRTHGRTRRVGSKAYQRMHVNLMDLGPLDHQFHTCLNRNLSNIERLALNRAIGDRGATRGGITMVRSKSDTRKRRPSWARVLRSWCISCVRSWPSNRSASDRTVRDFRGLFLINTDVLPF